MFPSPAYLVVMLLGVVLLLTLTNLLVWPRLNRGWPRPDPWPRVSVLVPARNEAANIGPCIASLTRQRYPDYEVILLDDQSTDSTAQVAGLADSSRRLKIIQGQPLPPGWLGKSWACSQLAQAATGKWLLFVDADTVHAPDMLKQTISTALRQRAGLLSGLPRQTSEGLGAQLLVSLQFLLTAAFLPVFLIPLRNDPSIVAASGAFMLFDRDLYRLIGGHAAVRGSMVDDLALARQVKRLGGRVVLADITPVVSCRMYRGWSEARAGFTKNAYPAMGRSLGVLLIAITAMGVLFLVPPAGLVGSLIRADANLGVWAAAWLLSTGIGVATYVRFRLPFWYGLLLPLQAASFVWIALNSAWRSWTGQGYDWKGRTYS
ncbi:MAG: glycosyltransferase [Bacillota bacterium]